MSIRLLPMDCDAEEWKSHCQAMWAWLEQATTPISVCYCSAASDRHARRRFPWDGQKWSFPWRHRLLSRAIAIDRPDHRRVAGHLRLLSAGGYVKFRRVFVERRRNSLRRGAE